MLYFVSLSHLSCRWLLNILLPVALTNVCAVVLLDIPTFTVIVVASTAVIVSATLLAGSSPPGALDPVALG